MRGKAAWRTRSLGLSVVLGGAVVGLVDASTARAQMTQTQWLATSSAGHDAIANCLARAMASELRGTPVVFPPPRRVAYVNFWPHANPPTDPVATFLVQPDRDRILRIGWQRLATSPAGARWDASARTAADRCATSG